MEDEFYLTVLSNANEELFDNKAYVFGNRISVPFEVSAKMRVALAEIQFTHAQAPVPSSELDRPELLIFDFLAPRGGGSPETGEKKYGKWYEVDFKIDKLNSPEEACLKLNEHIWKHIPRIRIAKHVPFSYSVQQDKIWYSYEKGQFYLVLIKGFLIKYLGIDSVESATEIACLGLSKRRLSYIYKKETRLFAIDCQKRFQSLCQTRNFFKNPPLNSMAGISEFVVYCSLAKPNHVGGSLVNHLRFIPLNDNNVGRRVCKNFRKLFYQKLATTEISEVFIQLRTVDGSYMKLGGITRCVLHFKKF